MEWQQTFTLSTCRNHRPRRRDRALTKPLNASLVWQLSKSGKRLTEIATHEPGRKPRSTQELCRTVIRQFRRKYATTGKTWRDDVPINEFGQWVSSNLCCSRHTKRTELRLRQSEMMSLLGSLVAGVAHEVRNPLFGISSILDAFETRFADRTEYLRYTNVLRDEIGRLTVLMEELLEYGKPFRGELYLVSIHEMVSRSIRACLPAASRAAGTRVAPCTADRSA
jgi:signal transduction histidine kinase